MGQVYQATDTKLNRQVALKILPEAFAADFDRLARFQREAQVLASLNHTGIATIHGLEEADDTRALVLELVEGAHAGGSHQAGADPARRGCVDRDTDGRSPSPDYSAPRVRFRFPGRCDRIANEGSDVAAVECRPRWSKDWADGPLRAACGTAPPWAVSRSPVTREGGANVRASLGGRRARGRWAATRGGPGWRSAGGGRCGAPRRRRGPPV